VNHCVSLSQYSILFYWPSSIACPMQNLIHNSFIMIFVYHFQHLPTFLAEIVNVNSSLVPL